MNLFDGILDAVISPAGLRRLRAGHLWIYGGDITDEPDGYGLPVVRVLDPARKQVGWALYSAKSQIRLRMLSRDSALPGPGFFSQRLESAVGRRRHARRSGAACRLVYGEADLLPSVIVDRYGEHVVLQTLSAGADALKPLLVEWLAANLKPASILERNDVKARLLEGLPGKRGLLWGTPCDRAEIAENDVRFLVDLAGGQKTGFYLDQAENRLAARTYASGRALDCFTNTGAFALHFARCCTSVLAVDTSTEALAAGRINAALNGINNVEFREANVFDLLRELDRSGEQFDTICLDPPAFAKNRQAVPSARGGYKEINLRAMKLLKPEGVLVTSSCSYHLGEWDFAQLLVEASLDLRRPVQVLEKRSQASDHPILAGMPETHYLKCFILRVL